MTTTTSTDVKTGHILWGGSREELFGHFMSYGQLDLSGAPIWQGPFEILSDIEPTQLYDGVFYPQTYYLFVDGMQATSSGPSDWRLTGALTHTAPDGTRSPIRRFEAEYNTILRRGKIQYA